jgi:hypothetical protein
LDASGQFYAAAALNPGKEPAVLIALEMGWDPEPVWTLWNKEKSLASAGNQTPVIQPVAYQYID